MVKRFFGYTIFEKDDVQAMPEDVRRFLLVHYIALLTAMPAMLVLGVLGHTIFISSSALLLWAVPAAGAWLYYRPGKKIDHHDN